MMRTVRRMRIVEDERGLALVEFACVLPVLLLMYLAGYQLTDALSCNRKVTIATRAVADLITQNSSVTTTQVNTILSASSKVLTPYSASNALIRVTEFTTDSNGNTTVTWSMDNRGGGRSKGTTFILPPAIKMNSTSIILSETVYSYSPAVTFRTVGPLTLSDTVYMNPRVSSTVDLQS